MRDIHARATGIRRRAAPPEARRPNVRCGIRLRASAWLRGGPAVVLGLLLAGCARRDESASDAPMRLAVEVRADTAAAVRLRIAPPHANVWVARVDPMRTTSEPELPEAVADTSIPESQEPPMLEIDDDLKPPILRNHVVLTVPDRAPGHGVRSVELDVRVDEGGEVTDALWAAGDADSALVQAATDCALAMKFYPAQQSGRPVPVWCRQRFDFGGRGRKDPGR